MDITKAKTSSEQPEQGAQIIIPCKTEEKKFRICEVCGHANAESEAICTMCSNYLVLGRGD